MHEISIRFLNITARKKPGSIIETTAQHQCQFATAMPMFWHRLPRWNSQKANLRFAVACLDWHLIGTPAKRFPFQVRQIATDIGSQRFRYHGRLLYLEARCRMFH